jgi:hypothetical protein
MCIKLMLQYDCGHRGDVDVSHTGDHRGLHHSECLNLDVQILSVRGGCGDCGWKDADEWRRFLLQEAQGAEGGCGV